MPLITGDYPSFLGGESQQDDTVRSPNQLTKAINAWLHAAMGAGKRLVCTVFVNIPLTHLAGKRAGDDI